MTDTSKDDDLTAAHMAGYHLRDDEVRKLTERAEKAEAGAFQANVIASHLRTRVAALEGALTPSCDTKAAYIGESSFFEDFFDSEGEERTRKITVPWTTIKEIMAAIRNFAALTAPDTQPIFDLIAHLHRQRDFSARTFGPGARTAGVCDHIRRELAEIEAAPADITEWVDVILLALDGAWRSGAQPEEIAAAVEAKQTKNERRDWPDWRTCDPNKAIEHNRGGEAPAPQAATCNDSLQVGAVKESLTTATADVLAAVRKLGAKERGWKPGDDAECMGEGDGELGLAAALYLLPYEATVGGEKLLKQDDFIRLDMILELTCGWSLKPIIDRRERLVQGVAFGLAEIERLDRAAQTDEPECCIACDKPFQDGDRYFPDTDGGYIHADCCGDRASYTNADGEPLGPTDPIPEPSVWGDERLDRRGEG